MNEVVLQCFFNKGTRTTTTNVNSVRFEAGFVQWRVKLTVKVRRDGFNVKHVRSKGWHSAAAGVVHERKPFLSLHYRQSIPHISLSA